MTRLTIVTLVCLAAGCTESPEDFPMEIRCAEQAYDSAMAMNNVGRSLFVAQTIIWLRKSAGLPLDDFSVPEAAKAEMFRLDAIVRPPEMPLPCKLTSAESSIAGDVLMTLDSASDGRDSSPREMLDALTE